MIAIAGRTYQDDNFGLTKKQGLQELRVYTVVHSLLLMFLLFNPEGKAIFIPPI